MYDYNITIQYGPKFYYTLKSTPYSDDYLSLPATHICGNMFIYHKGRYPTYKTIFH